MTDNEPVVAPLPTPISVEPVTVPAGQVAEATRQAEEAKVAKEASAPKAAEKPKDEPAKPLTAREALRAARDKVNAEPAPAKPLSVAAKEPAAEPAKEAPAKVDAKAAEPTAPVRGEDGKFVSTKAPAAEAPAKGEVAEAAKPTVPEAKPAAALPSHTANPPPARFSQAAKEKWAEAPEEVRAETERAVSELTKGFEKHRAAAERDAGLAEFHEMAAKGQTTVKEALAKYVGMENLLRTSPEKGIEEIFKNVGLSPKEWAAKLLGQTPDEAASAADATIRNLTARLEKAEAAIGTVHAEREQTKTATTTEAVTKFAAENPRFEELSDDIAFFLKSGRTKDLAEAYKLAERLNPAPAAKVEAVPEPAASSAPVRTVPTLVPSPSSSDAGTRSIAGTPTAGSDPVRKQPSSSIKEAIRRATAAAR